MNDLHILQSAKEAQDKRRNLKVLDIIEIINNKINSNLCNDQIEINIYNNPIRETVIQILINAGYSVSGSKHDLHGTIRINW